jgi:hypothetical protein
MKREKMIKKTKTILAAAILLCTFLYGPQVMAGEIYNLAWDVTSLKDAGGDAINYLEMDVEFGKRFFTAAGAIGYEDHSTALLHGSGYSIGSTYFFSVNSGSYIIIIQLESDINGEITIYGNDGTKIDSGTLTISGIQ